MLAIENVTTFFLFYSCGNIVYIKEHDMIQQLGRMMES